MSNDTLHSTLHLRGITEAMDTMAGLDEALDQYDCFHKGEIEVWAGDGYRLGVVFYADDHWQFRLDYAEVPANQQPDA